MRSMLVEVIHSLVYRSLIFAGRGKRWFASLPFRSKVAMVAIIIMSMVGTVGVAMSERDAANSSDSKKTTRIASSQTVTHRKVNVSEPIPYTSSTVDDPGLPEGTKQVRTVGVDGIRVRTFDVTYEGGREISRALISELVIQEPVQEVVAQGVGRKWEPREPYDWDQPRCEKKRGRYICLEE